MERKFETKPISKLVCKLGLPAMFAQFFNILYSMVDRMFVGHIAKTGSLTLASIGICAPALTAITAFASLIGIGGASLMSMSVGSKNREKAQTVINNAFLMLIVLSVLITVVTVILTRPLLFLLGCSEAMYLYASRYFRIYVLGTFAVLLGNGMNQFILAQGFARQGMFSVMIGAVINMMLDPVFIYGFHMGIAGAAIATVISQICVCIYVLWFLHRKDDCISISFGGYEYATMKQIIKIGCLPFWIMLLDNLLVILLNAALRNYGGSDFGDQYIACAAVVQSFMTLVFYPAQGITTGCGTLYSYHYGAGNIDKVLAVFRYVFLLCAGYMLLLCLMVQVKPEIFAGIFLRDAKNIKLTASFLQKYTFGLLGVAVQYAFVDGLTAMGQIKYALPISFFRKGVYIMCVFALPYFFSLEAVFWSESISDFIGATVTLVVFILWIVPRIRQEMA